MHVTNLMQCINSLVTCIKSTSVFVFTKTCTLYWVWVALIPVNGGCRVQVCSVWATLTGVNTCLLCSALCTHHCHHLDFPCGITHHEISRVNHLAPHICFSCTHITVSFQRHCIFSRLFIYILLFRLKAALLTLKWQATSFLGE